MVACRGCLRRPRRLRKEGGSRGSEELSGTGRGAGTRGESEVVRVPRMPPEGGGGVAGIAPRAGAPGHGPVGGPPGLRGAETEGRRRGVDLFRRSRSATDRVERRCGHESQAGRCEAADGDRLRAAGPVSGGRREGPLPGAGHGLGPGEGGMVQYLRRPEPPAARVGPLDPARDELEQPVRLLPLHRSEEGLRP